MKHWSHLEVNRNRMLRTRTGQIWCRDRVVSDRTRHSISRPVGRSIPKLKSNQIKFILNMNHTRDFDFILISNAKVESYLQSYILVRRIWSFVLMNAYSIWRMAFRFRLERLLLPNADWRLSVYSIFDFVSGSRANISKVLRRLSTLLDAYLPWKKCMVCIVLVVRAFAFDPCAHFTIAQYNGAPIKKYETDFNSELNENREKKFVYGVSWISVCFSSSYSLHIFGIDISRRQECGNVQ